MLENEPKCDLKAVAKEKMNLLLRRPEWRLKLGMIPHNALETHGSSHVE